MAEKTPTFNTFVLLDTGEKINFVLDIGKRSRISMDYREGVLRVKAPYGCPTERIQGFVTDNADWIKERTQNYQRRPGLPRIYENGERLRLMGEELILTTEIAPKYFPPKTENGKLIVAVNRDSDKDYVAAQTNRYINELAVREIKDSMERMSALTGLCPEKVTVKPMTASWGRCISNKHISINSKLVVYPKECMDYVCLHELCHLVYMNHSAEFWSLVSRYCPDWRRIRDELRGE